MYPFRDKFVLEENNFDYNNDKVLIKIGGLHSAKGLNNYSMYDIGNSVYELARINKRKSLHTVFLDRYFKDTDGKITDAMNDSTGWYTKNFKNFIQLGKPDKWTIIDLRPLRNEFYYQRRFVVNEQIKLYFDRYDLVIIPPTDKEPTLNISK